MKIIIKIKRYNPESDQAPYFQEFNLKVQPHDRLLDALVYIKENLDATLTFRKSCAHGVCGSDAMIINGKERLACKTLIQDLVKDQNEVITIEPLRSMPVQRDLYVNQENFFAQYRSIKPFLIPTQKPSKKEYKQAPEEQKAYIDPTKCILCSACHSSCPVIVKGEKEFMGPAVAAQIARFAFDSRDVGLEERRKDGGTLEKIRACDNHFNCTKVCPRGIKVTKNINLVKRAMKKDNPT